MIRTLLVAALFATPAAAQMSVRERAAGAETHPQLMAQYGGAYTGPGNAMVQSVGRRMAVAAGLSRDGSECTVTLLNSTVVNAFAVPGCYVYVTRGLTAIINDEAELASVLGHEIGHVAARHAQKRQTRSAVAGLGALAAAVLTGSSTIGQLAGTLGQTAVLGYSRGQEYEADSLGIGYLARAGYAPSAAADLLQSLQDEETLQARLKGRDDAAAIPGWQRSHPLTRDRIARAVKIARDTGAGGATNADAYLAAIDGQTWGDDPREGLVEGPAFSHPAFRIAFRAPPGFRLENTPTAVKIAGPGGEQGMFGGGGLQGGETIEGYVARLARGVIGNTGVEAGPVQGFTVGGLRAATLPLSANSNRGPVDLTVTAYEMGGGQMYHFITMSRGGGGGWERSLIGSFRRLSPAEAGTIRPRVLRVVTVRPGETVATMAARMAVSDLPAERFRAMNDLAADATLRPGQKVKLVALAPSP